MKCRAAHGIVRPDHGGVGSGDSSCHGLRLACFLMKRLATLLLLTVTSATTAICFAVEESWTNGLGSALAGLAVPEPADWMKVVAMLLVMAFIARRNLT